MFSHPRLLLLGQNWEQKAYLHQVGLAKKQLDLMYGNTRLSPSFFANMFRGPKQEVYDKDFLDIDQYGMSGKDLTRSQNIQNALDELYIPELNGLINLLDKKSNEFEKYEAKARLNLINKIYQSYDESVNQKYKVELNQRTIDRVKNSFQ